MSKQDEIQVPGIDGKMNTYLTRGETYEGKSFTVTRCHVCGENMLPYEGKVDAPDSYMGVRTRKVEVDNQEVTIRTWRRIYSPKYICNDCAAKRVPEIEHRHFSRPATIPAGDCTAEQKLKWLEALQEMKDAFDEQVLIIADVSTPSGEWATKAAIRLGIHIKHQEGVSA